jgi:hypothetical protein
MSTADETAVLVSGYSRIEANILVGLSVASARNMYRQGASIPESARATVNGRTAETDTILKAGDVLVFDEPTGTKG